MAKRGQFYPYRIKFRYPNQVDGTICLMNVADVNREGMALLRRGADIEVYAVDQATRARRLVRAASPADLPDDD